MIDLKLLRENRKLYEEGFAKKRVKMDVDKLLKLDDDYRETLQEVEAMRAERNEVSKEIPQLKDKEKQAKILEMKKLGEKLAKAEADLNQKWGKLKELADLAPNLPHESVPEGEEESQNEIVRTWGKPTKFDFEPKDHIALGKLLDLIDIESAAETSGSRFYYLKNEAVLLEFALIQWLFQKYVQKGFTPVTVPMLVREKMMYATGFFPADKNEIYHVNPGEDDLYLVGTSEVSLAGLHMNQAIPESELPRRYVGFSSCFRREAGSYGKDVKGILRVHQFDKVEMFSFCPPDRSLEEHEFLLSLEEEILQELGLPYRVVNICGGELGAPAAKKYDCEAWIPSEKRYREVTSCSNCTDFQARRGGLKYSAKGGSASGGKVSKGTEFVHTLNGTAMASTRFLIAILENHQLTDGSVKIPEILHPFLPNIKLINPKS